MRNVLLALIFIAPFSWGAVYKWQDADGITHYSNQPYEGASELSLLPSEAFSIPSVSKKSAGMQSQQQRAERKKLKRLRESGKRKRKDKKD